jgi:hypothetical protein
MFWNACNPTPRFAALFGLVVASAVMVRPPLATAQVWEPATPVTPEELPRFAAPAEFKDHEQPTESADVDEVANPAALVSPAHSELISSIRDSDSTPRQSQTAPTARDQIREFAVIPATDDPYGPTGFDPTPAFRPDSGGQSGLELVQPPHADYRLNPWSTDPAVMTRDQFWQQFATLPPDDPKARTAGYDSLRATLNNGFWFAGFDILYLEPMFRSNNAFTTSEGSFATAQPVDFGFEVSYRLNFGFQTNAGPAGRVTWWRLNSFSSLNEVFIGNGRTAVTTIDLGDTGTQVRLGEMASDGSRLTVRQQIKFDSTEITLYKDQVNPVSRMRGNLSLRHISLQQNLFAGLDDPAAGSQQIRNNNDYEGLGPKLGIEYFRPIGHTDLELQSGMSGSILFGRREQLFDAAGPDPLRFQQAGKVEPLSIFELYIGVQWNIEVATCRHLFFRTALESQLWAGSESALGVEENLGLYGISCGFGLTR